jgi:hypothetical protein
VPRSAAPEPTGQSDRFRHFVAIDWSGAKGQRQKGIAIALCGAGSDAPQLVRPGHRWSRAEVLHWLRRDLPDDALVGLDLSAGLPHADAEAFFPGWDRSPDTAHDLWRLVDDLSVGDDHLAVGGFLAEPEVWRHFRHGQGRCGDLFVPGAGRMRLTEHRARLLRLAPTSCFNLVGAAQVGKSSLTGMRVLHRLGGAIPVWPFDPQPHSGSVLVEIYTSLAARAGGIRPGRAKMLDGAALDAALAALGVAAHRALSHYTDHVTDALLSAAWLRLVADRADLWQPDGLTAQIARTEGWTFGVP